MPCIGTAALCSIGTTALYAIASDSTSMLLAYLLLGAAAQRQPQGMLGGRRQPTAGSQARHEARLAVKPLHSLSDHLQSRITRNVTVLHAEREGQQAVRRTPKQHPVQKQWGRSRRQWAAPLNELYCMTSPRASGGRVVRHGNTCS